MKSLLLLIILLSTQLAFSQKGKTYLGIQIKPIVPNRFIGHFEQPYEYESTPYFEGVIKQKPGYLFGMVISHGINDNISFESGINFTRRNFSTSYIAEDSGYSVVGDIGIINYDIPLNGIIYIRLSEAWYMNALAGLNLSFYPTGVFSQAPLYEIDNQFFQEGTRPSWVQGGINVNYGFEYREKSIGKLYIGASYYQPFNSIMYFENYWKNQATLNRVVAEVKGSYLTIDLKYYLPTSQF